MSGILFLAALVVMVIAAPLLQPHKYGPMVQAFSYTAALIAGLWAISRSRKVMLAAAAMLAPAVIAKWVHWLWPDLLPQQLVVALAMAPIGFIVVVLFRVVLTAPRVDANVLCAAVSNFLMIGILWAFGYELVDLCIPGSFASSAANSGSGVMVHFTPFYFSMITLCTVGYGDITPVSPIARMLAVLEAIAGTFYLAILISRLVSAYAYRQKQADSPQKTLP